MITTISLPNNREEFFDRALLLDAIPHMTHSRFGLNAEVAQNAGAATAKWFVPSALADADILDEGVNPDGKGLTGASPTATLLEFGDFLRTSSFKEATELMNVLSVRVPMLGNQLGSTIDHYFRDLLNGCDNAFLVGNVDTRADVAAVPDASFFDGIIEQLAVGGAMPFTEFVPTDDSVNTEPLPPCYIAIMHTHLAKTVRSLTGFVPVRKYAQNRNPYPFEIGTLNENLLCLALPDAKVFTGDGAAAGAGIHATGGKTDVYTVLAFGQNAYGKVKLRNKGTNDTPQNVEIIVGTPEQVGGPLRRSSTLGWVALTAGKILKQSLIVRGECAASMA